MDPASGAIIFVGFAASITTLAAVLLKSCKTLRQLCHDIRDAPKDLQRLFLHVQNLERMVLEIKRTGGDIASDAPITHLNDFWVENVRVMREDLSSFNQKLCKLFDNLGKRTFTSKSLRARLYKVFSKDDIIHWERILAQHVDKFNILYNIVLNERSKATLDELQLHSRKLDALQASANSYEATLRDELRMNRDLILGNNDVIVHSVKAEISKLSRQLPNEKRIMSHLHDQEFSLEPLSKNLDRSNSFYPNEAFDVVDSGCDAQLVVSCKFVSFKLALGVLTVRKVSTTALQNWSSAKHGRTAYQKTHISFSLFPASWLSQTVIQFSYHAKTASGVDVTDTGWNLKQRHYNTSKTLPCLLNRGDIDGIREMFRRNEATPHDLLAPWGNTLLHEAVLRCAAGVPNMLVLSLFLLRQGVDPNIQNVKGSTALLQICSLMNRSPTLAEKLRPLADSIIRDNNADLTINDKEGHSACTLIFQGRHGLAYLEQFVSRYIDLVSLHSMDSVDFWLVTTLTRSFPTFQRSLEAENESYRTPTSLSSLHPSKRDRLVRLTELDFDTQIQSLKEAKAENRTVFMKALCAKGTLGMVQPFLSAGLDLDELNIGSQTYLRTATRAGNFKVAGALMEAGATVDGQSNFWDPNNTLNGTVDELIERWHSLDQHRPDFDDSYSSLASEFWILPKMLQNPTFKNPNVLLLAVWSRVDSRVFKTLLQYHCGRRDGQPAASIHLQTYGSEVIEAIKCNNKHVSSMLEAGLAMEVEDKWGCTALIHAIDRGRGTVDFVRLLVNSGADLERRTSCGYTPLDFAELNMRAKHPRLPQRTWSVKSVETSSFRPISLQQDQETYTLLKQSIAEKTGYRAVLRIPSLTSPTVSFRQVVLEHAAMFKRDWSELGLGIIGLTITLVALISVKVWALVWRVTAFVIKSR